jgi:hypothetical protein
MKFVQKAVQLLWRGLDLIVDPHESVGRELWKDVGPADLGEMAADVEMQKAFVGMKRPRGVSFQGEYDPRHGDRTSPLSTQRISKSGLQPNLIDVFNAPPPNKGLAPAPQLPRMVQECSPNARRFVYFEAETDGYWAVQQAVQSIRDVQLWNGTPSIENRGDAHHLEYTFSVNAAPQELQSTELSLQQNDTHETQQFQPVQYQMSHVNYDYSSGNHQQEPRRISVTYPPAQVHTDDPALIHANLIEFNAMAQLYAHDQSAPAPDAITYDGMLKSCGAISNGANDYYDVSNTTPRMTHNTNDIGMHAVNESTISAGFLDSMYGANVAQQLCTQPMDQNFHGADQKVSALFTGNMLVLVLTIQLIYKMFCCCHSRVE